MYIFTLRLQLKLKTKTGKTKLTTTTKNSLVTQQTQQPTKKVQNHHVTYEEEEEEKTSISKGKTTATAMHKQYFIERKKQQQQTAAENQLNNGTAERESVVLPPRIFVGTACCICEKRNFLLLPESIRTVCRICALLLLLLLTFNTHGGYCFCQIHANILIYAVVKCISIYNIFGFAADMRKRLHSVIYTHTYMQADAPLAVAAHYCYFFLVSGCFSCYH